MGLVFIMVSLNHKVLALCVSIVVDLAAESYNTLLSLLGSAEIKSKG